MTDDSHILLIKRTGLYGGYWAIPGGKLRFGEDLEEAAFREIYEEAGIRVRLTGLKGVFTEVTKPEVGESHHFVLFVFTAETLHIEVRASDEGEIKWFDINDLDKMRVIPSDLAILREIFRSEDLIVAKKIVMASDSKGELSLECYENLGSS